MVGEVDLGIWRETFRVQSVNVLSLRYLWGVWVEISIRLLDICLSSGKNTIWELSTKGGF